MAIDASTLLKLQAHAIKGAGNPTLPVGLPGVEAGQGKAEMRGNLYIQYMLIKLDII